MVTVRDVDRRVLRVHVAEEVGELALITCVCGWVGQAQSSERVRLGFGTNFLPWLR